jgi:hypothetical protein
MDELREVNELDPSGSNMLPESYKIMAIEEILTGKIKEHVGFLETESLDEVYRAIMNYALKNRIEAQPLGTSPMDLSKMGKSGMETQPGLTNGGGNWGGGAPPAVSPSHFFPSCSDP